MHQFLIIAYLFTLDLISNSQAVISLADSSDLGWSVVKEYQSNPLAFDSKDEKRMMRAEARASRKKATQVREGSSHAAFSTISTAYSYSYIRAARAGQPHTDCQTGEGKEVRLMLRLWKIRALEVRMFDRRKCSKACR